MPHELSCSSLLRELGVFFVTAVLNNVWQPAGTFWISTFVLLFWNFFFFFFLHNQLVPSLNFKKIR